MHSPHPLPTARRVSTPESSPPNLLVYPHSHACFWHREPNQETQRAAPTAERSRRGGRGSWGRRGRARWQPGRGGGAASAPRSVDVVTRVTSPHRARVDRGARTDHKRPPEGFQELPGREANPAEPHGHKGTLLANSGHPSLSTSSRRKSWVGASRRPGHPRSQEAGEASAASSGKSPATARRVFFS